MSKSRLFSVFVIVALITVAVLLVRGGITTAEVAAHQNVLLDQHERHPGFINPSAVDSAKAAALAEQTRLEFRRGEWSAGNNLYAPLDAHERHAAANMTAAQARLEFRRGEWSMDRTSSTGEFDVEQARIEWRAGK